MHSFEVIQAGETDRQQFFLVCLGKFYSVSYPPVLYIGHRTGRDTLLVDHESRSLRVNDGSGAANLALDVTLTLGAILGVTLGLGETRSKGVVVVVVVVVETVLSLGSLITGS